MQICIRAKFKHIIMLKIVTRYTKYTTEIAYVTKYSNILL